MQKHTGIPFKQEQKNSDCVTGFYFRIYKAVFTFLLSLIITEIQSVYKNNKMLKAVAVAEKSRGLKKTNNIVGEAVTICPRSELAEFFGNQAFCSGNSFINVLPIVIFSIMNLIYFKFQLVLLRRLF